MQGKEKDESVTVLASVVALFAKRKGTGEHFVYCRMALSSKALMFSILKVEMQKEPPLQFLQNAQCHHAIRRLGIQLTIENGYPFIPPISFSIISMSQMYHFCAMYKERLQGKLALARKQCAKANYTFHLVTRLLISSSSSSKSPSSCSKSVASSSFKSEDKCEKKYYQLKAEKAGGELAIHRFICFQEVYVITFCHMEGFCVLFFLMEEECIFVCCRPQRL